MKFAPILTLLQQRTGLTAELLGSLAVQAAITGRQQALGIDDPRFYAARLEADPVEFAALIDAVVVPETWFFRGGDLFWYLAEHIRTATFNRPANSPFRVLSLPCSTGEEPYSLAIALTEIGVPSERWTIDAIDISPRHIALAQRAVYSELAFRQLPDELRQRYFRPVDKKWQLGELRSRVRFQVGNILDPGLLLQELSYHLIFCRNLFIYLEHQAKQQAMQTLARLVAPDGLLALGHAETIDREIRFTRTGPDGHFLYRRAALPIVQPSLPVTPVQKTPPSVAKAIRPDTHPRDRLDDLLNQAWSHADLGRYVEALEVCRSVQAQFGPSADLYALMGIIHQAREEPTEAIASLNRALYLQPEHREALFHLMLLYQSQGEQKHASALRRRLERLSASPGETP